MPAVRPAAPPRPSSSTSSDAHSIPEPETNTIIEHHEVDAVWRTPESFIVELDSHAFHRTGQSLASATCRRDRELTGAGLAGRVRITWRALHDEREGAPISLRA